jgi:hypothetical protein
MKNIFRGKNTNNNEWVYGYYYANPVCCYILPIGWEISERLDAIQVDSKTIDEFTGLIDKDRYNIFENDLRVDNRNVIFRIYRVDGGFAIKADYWKSNCKDLVLSDDLILEPLANPQVADWLIENSKHFGTIHEHPELR